MRERLKQLLAFGLALLLLTLCGCGGPAVPETAVETPAPTAPPQTEPAAETASLSGKSKVTTAYFGTVCSMVVFDDFSDPAAEGRFQRVWKELKDLLAEIENAVSVSIESSDVARFNALPCGESLEIGGHTAQILQIAKRAWADTDGLYDPCVFPLVDLWGFSPRFAEIGTDEPLSEAYPPEESYIRAFAALADFSGVQLTGGGEEPWRLEKAIPAVTVNGRTFEAQLDLGGVAKGYAADACAALMRERGYEYGYFSCGGSSLSLLSGREGEENVFLLGMKKPRGLSGGDISYITVPAARCGLSTSGDYDHCRIADGIRYCHILSPVTGWPANTPAADERQRGIATATVIGEDAAYADCLSTALCLMAPPEALAFINERMNGYRAALVFYGSPDESCEVVTNLPAGSFTIDDERYHLAGQVDERGRLRYTGQIFADLFACDLTGGTP